jgi:hypothetical protein
MGLIKVVTWMVLFNFVACFNIDTRSPYIYEGKAGTYFGYSIAFNNDKGMTSVVVGAPFSTDTNEGNHNWGSVFKCNYIIEDNPSKTCEKLHTVDAEKNRFKNADKENQMMGATVYSDNIRTLVCAPRYKATSEGVDKQNIWMVGKCEVIYPLRMDRGGRYEQYIPCEQYANDGSDGNYENCQAGFSGQLDLAGAEDKGDYKVIGGAPTFMKFNDKRVSITQGLLGRFSTGLTKFTNGSGLDISDYLGYSVSSGNIFGPDALSVAGGAPRANMLAGNVLLYKVTKGPFERAKIITDPSLRPGSYFGSAIAVTNIDNDEKKLDDLVVGAPYFSSGQQSNEGAVYVYLNLNEGLELRQTIYGDREKNACFGFAIGSVGDLNQDANNDILVGAPWGGEKGNGVVYVYYGQPSKHEPLLLKQKITPKDVNNGDKLKGFGFSFAEYYPYSKKDKILNDIDENDYPDVAIGSYKSDQVVVLRTRPVVTIQGTVELLDMKYKPFKKIDLYDTNPDTICTAPDGKKYKCLHVRVGFTKTGVDGDVKIEYTVNVDADAKVSKRGFFMARDGAEKGQKKQKYVDTMTIGDNKKVYSIRVFLVNNTKDIVRKFMVRLDWKMLDDVSSAQEIRPVANKMLYSLTTVTVAYIKGCKSENCKPDLVLSLTSMTDRIASGITDVLKIKAVIQNKGENAYLNKLRIVYPLGIQPNKVQIKDYPGTVIWDPNVSLDKQNIYTLEVQLSSPIKAKTEEVVDIQFGIGSMPSSTKLVTLNGEAVTESEEVAPADNTDTVSVGIVLVANLTISGSVSKEFLRWNKDVKSEKTPGPLIQHTLLLQNRGPSDISDGELSIAVPVKIESNYVLNVVKFDKRDPEFQCTIHGDLNPVGLNVTFPNDVPISRSTSEKKNETTTTGRSRKRRGVDKQLGCTGGEANADITCLKITCSNIKLKKSKDASVTIHSTLVEWTFEKFIKENRKLSLYAKFVSKAVKKPKENPAPDDIEIGFTVLSPHDTVKKDSTPLAWWIILLCVLAALIIILGVVAILYKRGFFKRTRASAEEEQLNRGEYEDEEEE